MAVATPTKIPTATAEPTSAPTATTPRVPKPEPTAPSTYVPQAPTTTTVPGLTTIPASPLPTPTTRIQPPPKAVHTSELSILRLTIAEVPANLLEYDRHDWKHWTDDDCQDARNGALVAASRAAVSFKTDRRCRVAAGEWLAPYTTTTVVTNPSKLDVDHMAPLGNARDSGAWRWSAQRKECYTNYFDDPQHLIAVTASANRSKGARGPAD